MVGFPTYVLTKHLNRLNEKGYTVVVFDQQMSDTEKSPSRHLKGVYSYLLRMESMEEEEDQDQGSERILYGLHIEKYKTHPALFYKEQDTRDLLRDSVQWLMGCRIEELLVDWTGSLWTSAEITAWNEKLETTLGCRCSSFLNTLAQP